MLLLGDDLQQDAARNVFLGLLVDDDELHLVQHQAADVGQRDVAALNGVIQPAVRIFLDDSRLAHLKVPPAACLWLLAALHRESKGSRRRS